MTFGFVFFINSILLGFGLAMDAFSVSAANGLNESSMKFSRMSLIAGCYGVFQFAMPLTGWVCVHTVVKIFTGFEKCIPYFALVLLLYIGIDMIADGVKSRDEKEKKFYKLTFGKLLVQGVATSIDALSVGFTISDYSFTAAFVCCVIIAVVTYLTSLAGLEIGKKAGMKLSGKATLTGGCILIIIGMEIFIRGVFF